MRDFIGVVVWIVVACMFGLGFSIGKSAISNDCDRLNMFYLHGTTYSCKPVETEE